LSFYSINIELPRRGNIIVKGKIPTIKILVED